MAEYNPNDIGHAAVTVGNTPVFLPVVYQTDGKGNLTRNPQGQPLPAHPTHALIYTDKAIRWRADGSQVNSGPGEGMFVPGGAYIDWTSALHDYRQLISQVQFVKDSSAVGVATLEITFFN